MALTKNTTSKSLVTEVALLKQRVELLEEVLREKKILEESDTSWEIVRAKRNYLLKSTDWTVTPGSSLDQAQWAVYRQILRDIPQTYVDFGDVVWPIQPSTDGPNMAPVE